jgi:hypothetical protein
MVDTLDLESGMISCIGSNPIGSRGYNLIGRVFALQAKGYQFKSGYLQ